MDNLVFATAIELARAIRERETSAVEVMEAHLAQIARNNPLLNAIVTLDQEHARARALAADGALTRGEVWGPLHGVPVTIKDALETAGLRTTAGFPPLADYVPSTDATVVARLRTAGAIILGKTNMPTLARDFQTDNPIFGRTNNPWDLTRTPGGSTGGGAAAVAAGLTPLEIGSDYGGSVRIPAHYCGIYTLKPTENRVPTTGYIDDLPGTPRRIQHMNVLGPMARSLDELALALRLIAGPDHVRWEVPPVPVEPAPDRTLGELRLAWLDDVDGVPVSSETRTALANLVAELERGGCRVEHRMPDRFDFTAAWETWGEIHQAEAGSTMPPEIEVEEAMKSGLTLDAAVPMARGQARAVNATMRQYTATMMRREALIRALQEFFETWDALLCPVTVGPAIAHCPFGSPISVDEHEVPYMLAGTAHCNPINVTGHPAVVLPLARSAEGLPIGLQIVGPLWSEMQILAIAKRLTELIGPFQPPPGY